MSDALNLEVMPALNGDHHIIFDKDAGVAIASGYFPDKMQRLIDSDRHLATLTAELEKHRELVEAVERWDKCDSTLTVAKINAGPPAISLAKQLLDEAERGLRTALAQLKEQDDE